VINTALLSRLRAFEPLPVSHSFLVRTWFWGSGKQVLEYSLFTGLGIGVLPPGYFEYLTTSRKIRGAAGYPAGGRRWWNDRGSAR